MKTVKNNSYLEGKTGRIYSARKGTVLVYLLDNGESWFATCSNPTNIIHRGPVEEYWKNSIDFAGSFSDYFTFGMAFDAENKPHYPAAEPIVPISDQQIQKLKIRAKL